MREIKLKENTAVTPCPKCSNNRKFKAHSHYCAEDCCNVWVECNCGFDPTKFNTDYRFEDVWGGTDDTNCLAALYCWNDAVEDFKKGLIKIEEE